VIDAIRAVVTEFMAAQHATHQAVKATGHPLQISVGLLRCIIAVDDVSQCQHKRQIRRMLQPVVDRCFQARWRLAVPLHSTLCTAVFLQHHGRYAYEWAQHHTITH
jgi:hypothetical protein